MTRHFSTHRNVCWRLTLKCNRACVFCLSRSSPRHDHSSVDPFAIIERLQALGVEKLSYTGGEPLLYPKIERVIAFAERLGLLQVLTTNGDLLHNGLPSWLRKLEHINLSFYGDAESHDSLMGPGNYRSLLSLSRQLVAHGITTSANYMCTRASLKLVPAFLHDALSYGFYDATFQTYVPNGRRHADSSYSLFDTEATIKHLGRLAAPYASAFGGGLRIYDYSKDYWCLVLDADGYLALPTNERGNVTLGQIMQDYLQFPDLISPIPIREAVENVWERRLHGPGIIAMEDLAYSS